MAFTPRQVQRILERASEAERADNADAGVATLSGAELRTVAVEAGLSAGAVDQAIREIETQPSRSVSSAAHFVTEVFPAAMRPATADALLTQLRLQFGGPGTVYHIGRGFEWHGHYKGRLILCTIRPEGEGTRISLQVGNKSLLPDSEEIGVLVLGTLVLGAVTAAVSFGLVTLISTLGVALLLALVVGALYAHDAIATRTAERTLRTAFANISTVVAVEPSDRHV